eukprot:1159713-Pelagomonas_calceolata.AAC.4
MHLTSKPLDARGPIRPSTSSANQARGSAECGHGEQGGQIGGGGAGTSSPGEHESKHAWDVMSRPVGGLLEAA